MWREDAYILKSTSNNFKKIAQKFFYQLEEIEAFYPLPNDDFVKFSSCVEEECISQVVEQMNIYFNGNAKAVRSGNDDLDIMLHDTNKVKNYFINGAFLLMSC